MAAINSLQVHSNNVKQWLPKNFAAAQDYDWFIERFGVDEMIVASWAGCQLGDEQVNEFRFLLENRKTDEGRNIFDQVITAHSTLDRLESMGIGSREAQRRIRGLMIGPDDRTTCVMAFPSSESGLSRTEVVNEVYRTASEDFELPPSDLKLAGPTVDAAVIDVESRRALDSFMWMTVVIVFVLSWIRLKDFAISLAVLGFSLICAFLSLSILYWTGGTMNLTMVMMPTLIFILGVSASVHMANYYRKAVKDGEGRNAADRALRDGAVPVTLSAVTTAIGLASLAASQVTPIRMFGIYSAIGIVASLPVILLLMPAVMYQLRGRISRRSAGEHKTRREGQTGVSDLTSLLVHRVCRHHWLVTVPALVMLLILSFGISFLKGSVNLQNRFSDRTKIIQDYAWLEANLGPLVPLEVVLGFDVASDISSWQQMLLVERLERDLIQDGIATASLSAATFKPKLSKSRSLTSRLKSEVTMDRWENDLQKLVDANLVQTEGNHRFWRMSLRVPALSHMDYGKLLDNVETRVNDEIARLAPQGGVSARFTGGIPLFYHAQHQILKDLRNSFITAFLLISAVLVLVLRSFRAGLVAMIPNIFPPLFVLGDGLDGVAGRNRVGDDRQRRLGNRRRRHHSLPHLVPSGRFARPLTAILDSIRLRTLCQAHD